MIRLEMSRYSFTPSICSENLRNLLTTYLHTGYLHTGRRLLRLDGIDRQSGVRALGGVRCDS